MADDSRSIDVRNSSSKMLSYDYIRVAQSGWPHPPRFHACIARLERGFHTLFISTHGFFYSMVNHNTTSNTPRKLPILDHMFKCQKTSHTHHFRKCDILCVFQKICQTWTCMCHIIPYACLQKVETQGFLCAFFHMEGRRIYIILYGRDGSSYMLSGRNTSL